MNNLLKKINIYIYFSSLFIIILFLFLFLSLINLDFFLLYNHFQEITIDMSSDNLRINHDLDKSLDNSENISSERSYSSHCNRISSSSSSSCSCSCSCSCLSEDINHVNLLGKYKKTTSRLYHKYKDKINNKTKSVAHKIKKFEKTITWFFKGSNPGGGRGL